MASEIKVDTISENTSANGITIDGVNIKDGTITGANLGRKNYIINGNFDIWQRGTSFTATGYIADRWYAIVSGTGTTTISQQSFTLGQTDVPNEPKYYLRIAKSSGATSGDYLSSKNESVRTFAGQATVISFYAKASAATTLTPTIRQNFGTSGSPSSVNDAVKSDISVTTSWQKFTITHTFDSISGKTLGTDNNDHIELFFNIQNAAGDSIDFAQFQWEKGSVATDFEVRPIVEEQNLCDRYFQSWGGDSAYETIASGCAVTTTQYRGYIAYRTMMREAPTSSVTGDWEVNGAGTSTTSSEAIIRHGKSSGELNATIDTAKTAGQSFGFRARNDLTARFTLDAEL